jgi:hypothetical protein
MNKKQHEKTLNRLFTALKQTKAIADMPFYTERPYDVKTGLKRCIDLVVEAQEEIKAESDAETVLKRIKHWINRQRKGIIVDKVV